MKQVMGKYRLSSRIAMGGMAEIYHATRIDHGGGDALCVKKIRPQYSDDLDFVNMFRQEAEIAMALRHVNVVQVLDFGSDGDEMFIVMEYVDGMDLRTLLGKCRALGVLLPVDFVLYVARCLLGALDAASRVKVNGELQAVVHRDISPHNLLLSVSGDVKLTDFGIAKAKGSSTVTRTGIIKGKMAYMSPEQANARALDPRSDLYGVGVVLQEMLVGERMYSGVAESELLACVLNYSFSPIPWLSESINVFLSKLLARSPDDRFANAAEAMSFLDASGYAICDAARAGVMVQRFRELHVPVSNYTSSLKNPFSSRHLANEHENAATKRALGPIPSGVAWRRRWRYMAVVLSVLVLAMAVFWGSVAFDERDKETITGIDVDVHRDGADAETGVVPVRPGDTGDREPVSLIVDVSSQPVSERDTGVGEESATGDTDLTMGGNDADMPSLVSRDSDDDVRSTEVPAVQKKYGAISVTCRPWARVRIGKRDLGTTPVWNKRLPSGAYQVELVNEVHGFRKVLPVVITHGETTVIKEVIE